MNSSHIYPSHVSCEIVCLYILLQINLISFFFVRKLPFSLAIKRTIRLRGEEKLRSEAQTNRRVRRGHDVSQSPLDSNWWRPLAEGGPGSYSSPGPIESVPYLNDALSASDGGNYIWPSRLDT